MRTRVPALCLAIAALLFAASADAGALTSATWLQVTQGVPMTRTTAQLGATGTSTSSSIAVNLAYPQFTLSFFVPKDPLTGVLDLAFKITQGGPQAITATAGMGGGTPGVPGSGIVRTQGHIAMGVNQSMFIAGINTLVAVPISVGKAGQFNNQFSVLGVTHTITVDFFAWTPGMQTFTGLTTKGAALPTVMAAGSFNLTANGGGTVTLVSPRKGSVHGVLAQGRTASFTTLKLTFVPEASTLLLIGAVLGAVVLATRR